MKMVNTLKRNKLFLAAIIVFLSVSVSFGAKQNTYTTKATPVGADKVLIADSEDSNKTKQANINAMRSALGLGATDSPVFAGVDLGEASTTIGLLKMYGNTKAYPFQVFSLGADAPGVGWRWPATVPSITSLVTVDSNGYWAYLDPATLGGGYTNLTQFLTQTANSVFYSDASGDVKELILGSSGTYLKSNGPGSAPTFEIPSGAAHDAVTLGTDADAVLGLSTQQLTLDSQTANYFFAAPNGLAGDPTFRAIVAADIPTLNQNTSGTAAGLTAQYIDWNSVSGGSSIANKPTIPTAASLSVDDLITLSGVATGAVNLGAFTGATIADNSTVKGAIQAVETSVETKANASSIAFEAATWADLKILDTTHTTAGTGIALVQDSMAYANTDDAYHLWSIDKIGSELAGKQATISFGTNVQTALGVNIGSAGAPVLFNGAGGTPTSLALTNAILANSTSLPGTCTVGQLYQDTDADTDGDVYFCRATNTWKAIDDDGGAGGLATTDIDTSAELRAILTDEVGTGAAYFVGGALGTPASATLTNATGLPVSGITASTSTAIGVGSIDLGHASDTTIARSSAGVATIEGLAIDRLVASGSVELNTTTVTNSGVIASGSSQLLATHQTATGAATTDGVEWAFVGDPVAKTGFIPSANGMLTIWPYVDATGFVQIRVSNNTATSITLNTAGSGATIKWMVRR